MRNRIAWLAIALTIAACYFPPEIDPFDLGGQCGSFLAPRPCVALGISPDSAHFLRGDTLQLVSFSDSGHIMVSWALTGDALRFVTASGLVTQLPASMSPAAVVALTIGAAQVTAT